MNTNTDSLAQSLDSVKYSLQNLIIGEDSLKIAFGEEYDRLAASTILSAWNNGDFGQIPTIQIIDGTILNGANAGYALANNTIYVSDYFLANSSGDRIAKVLTEEIGHFFDAQINTVDPVWDEGEVFADLVTYSRGERPFATTINRRPEDDSATIYIDGVAIQIEQSIDLIGQWGGSFNSVKVVSNYAYIAKKYELLILDISDPNQPITMSTIPACKDAVDLEVVSNTVYMADGRDGLVIVDVSNPFAPHRLGGYDTSGYAWDVEVVDNIAYIADHEGGLVIVDVSNPFAPYRLGKYDTSGCAIRSWRNERIKPTYNPRLLVSKASSLEFAL